MTTAAANNLASCHLCCKLSSASESHCSRCGAPLHVRKTNSLQRTLALLITANVLYVPANVFPIMITDQLGQSVPSTIIGGVVLLIQLGSIPVAAVIFIASVIVPLSKFLIMYYLVWAVANPRQAGLRQHTQVYRVTEFIGKWSMIDVFVVAILVALVHLGGIIEIRPGIAALSFAGVVITTMIAAESFDSRLLWDHLEAEKHD